MSLSPDYTAEAVTTPDGLTDVRIRIQGKTWHLWGRSGPDREEALANKVSPGTLPVLIGSGLGKCARLLAERGTPVAIVDKEAEIDRITGTGRALAAFPNIIQIHDDTPQAALDRLTRWQADNGGKPFAPVILPVYLRLDRQYYGALAETLKTNAQSDFWSQARYPKFRSATPRILFLDSNYFLCEEILAAFKRLDMTHHTITLDRSGVGDNAFIEELLRTVIDFRPDFVLTVNHFGLDRQGKLAGLLEDLGLPLASWFVDNPHLILHQYDHPGADNTAIFTYDAGNLAPLRDKGFANVHYLPLATDPSRFRPTKGNTPPQWTCDVSFVGNSMTGPVAKSLEETELPRAMRSQYEEVAAGFGESGSFDVATYLEKNVPVWHNILKELPTRENRLALESLLTWEATRQYRLSCVSQLLPFSPLIVGDDGWLDLLDNSDAWRHLSGLDYYEELPRFYPRSKINFNCTSRQMIGAVNQRVFDVPACGGFVLTDYREQMESLFDLATEVVVYHDPEEIPELIKRYIDDPESRKTIAAAARRRILAEHTYEMRMKRLVSIMRETFTT